MKRGGETAVRPIDDLVRTGRGLVVYLCYLAWPLLLPAALVLAPFRMIRPQLAATWLPSARAVLVLPVAVVARALQHRLWSLAAGMILLAPLLGLTLASFILRVAPGSLGAITDLALLAPSIAHPFGTDAAGRDLLWLVIAGAGNTYCIGLVGGVVALSLGVVLGLATAYRRAEPAVMVGVQIVEALPVLVWALMVMSAYAFWTSAFEQQSAARGLLEALRTPVSAAVIGISMAPRVIRLVRDQLKFFEGEEFIVHTRAHGVSMRRILWYHVLLKNTLPDLLVIGAALPGVAIFTQINLDYFFSLSSFRVAAAATVSWTQLLLANEARRALLFFEHGWLVFFPTVCLVATTLGCLLWGTGLRRARTTRVFDMPMVAPAPALPAPEAAPLAGQVSP